MLVFGSVCVCSTTPQQCFLSIFEQKLSAPRKLLATAVGETVRYSDRDCLL
jgi:hypothetical protein